MGAWERGRVLLPGPALVSVVRIGKVDHVLHRDLYQLLGGTNYSYARLSSNTELSRGRDEPVIRVFLHSNKIMEYTTDGRITLWSNGWLTPTTIGRMNDLLDGTGYYVHDRKGRWELVFGYGDDGEGKIIWPFVDGITILGDNGKVDVPDRDVDWGMMIRENNKVRSMMLSFDPAKSIVECRHGGVGSEASHLHYHMTRRETCKAVIATGLLNGGYNPQLIHLIDGGRVDRIVNRAVRTYTQRVLGLKP